MGEFESISVLWPLFWLVTREMLLLAALGIILFGLDELFIDAVYLWTRTRRALTIYRRYGRWTAMDVPRAVEPGRMAIFLPAWDEADVIGRMLSQLLATLDHGNYRLFAGVYANDPATLAAVEAVRDSRIEIVVSPRAGPTTKADCLNALWAAMRADEAASGVRYKAIVLHDAEDVVHPAELAVFDHLIPRKAMVQLPVVPLPDPDSRWISGHYLDEFAETHRKTMVAREALGAALPSAGVACAFERGALGEIADVRGGAPFDPDSLTEDYELGMTMSRGGRGAFVRLPDSERGAAVATREHFPADFEAALRQKTRWLTGIAFQGWDRLRWRGGLADKYMLLRDRKPAPNALFILLAYLGALLFAGAQLAVWLGLTPAAMPPVVEPGSALSRLILVTTALLVWRLATRFCFTAADHGLGEGFMSLPRALVANVIAILAARRALAQYAGLVFRGRRLVWHKTAHRYPGDGAGD